jgi:hypothetical protein
MNQAVQPGTHAGQHRVTYAGRHASADTRIGPLSPNDGAHATACSCERGYVCLMHRTAR